MLLARWLPSVLPALFPLVVAACTSDPEPAESARPLQAQAETEAAKPPAGKLPASLPKQTKAEQTPDPCLRFTTSVPPVWVRERNLVITNLLNECVTRDGHKGYRRDSSWVAMGFPCSGGQGKIDVGGPHYAPKIVSFIMATDCPMQPAAPAVVADTGRKVMNLESSARLLAYNPFAVQYWEVPGLSDANVGFTIDLRSVEGTQRVWRDFIERRPLPVKLWGRENAWVLGHHFYFVDGQLTYTSPTTFRLEVKELKALSDDEIKDVKQRCEALRPRRNCHLVFN